MSGYDQVYTTPSVGSARRSESFGEGLQRRFKKRVQLEYYKLTSGDASFAHAILTVFTGVACVVLAVVVCNGFLNILFHWSTPEPNLPTMPRQVSVVIPTYHERENIPNLVERVFK
ncbi:hypothetical protein SARC_12819, partial [Sphaeroforma arctica JP610]